MKYIFILPVKDDWLTLVRLIEKINLLLKNKFNYHFIVVDDSKSVNNNLNNIKNLTLINGGSIGLGYAIYIGIKSALEVSVEGDYFCIVDTDGQVEVKDILKFFSKKDQYPETDIFLSSRFLQKDLIKYKYPFLNLIGTKLLKSIINFYTNYKVTDSHGGIRLFKYNVGKKIKILGEHTYIQEFLLDAYDHGFKVQEIPTVWLIREFGKSKVVSSILKYAFNVAPILFVKTNLHKMILYNLGIFFLFFFFYKLLFDFQFNNSFLVLTLSVVFFLAGYILEIGKMLLLSEKYKK